MSKLFTYATNSLIVSNDVLSPAIISNLSFCAFSAASAREFSVTTAAETVDTEDVKTPSAATAREFSVTTAAETEDTEDVKTPSAASARDFSLTTAAAKLIAP